MAKISFDGELDPHELADLGRATRMVTYKRGEIVYTPETTDEALLILDRGRVNIYRLTADGHKLVIATMKPRTIFGLRWLTGAGSGSFAEAVEDSEICVVTPGDLERIITTHPRLALRLIGALASRLEDAETRLVTLAFRNAPARLAATLLRLLDEDGQDAVAATHQELAELVGANRETVTRLLDQFRSRGLLEPRRGRIRILNAEGLRRLVDD